MAVSKPFPWPLLAIVCVVSIITTTKASTPLPVRWLWLERQVPAVARPALREWLSGLPAELCRLGPANATALKANPDFMTQLCPLTASASTQALAALDMARFAAAAPTLGTAAILLAFDGDARAAGALERRLCEFFLNPAAACGWPPSSAPVSTGFAELLAANEAAGGAVGRSVAALNSSFVHATALARAAAAEAATALRKALPSKPAANNASTAVTPAAPEDSSAAMTTAAPRNPWSIVGDLPERALEAAVQNAIKYFGYNVPVSRARAVNAVLPPALRPYAAAGIEGLPSRLCAAVQGAPAELASAPDAFKDELCPLANLFKPALGGVGLSSWGLIAAQISMGIDVEANAWHSPSSSSSGSDAGVTPAGVPPAAVPQNITAANDGAASDAFLNATMDPNAPTLTIIHENGTDEYMYGPSPAEAAKQAKWRHVFDTVAYSCGVLYAPELACNATVVSAVADRARWQGMGDDAWGAYSAVRANAAPAQLDAALLRIDGRRFAAVGALSAALARVPAAQRAALAAAVMGPVTNLAPAIRSMPPVAAVAAYGPLFPFVCLMQPEQAHERVLREWVGGLAVITEAVARTLLRIDAPAGALAALAGGSSKARPALDAACQALKDAGKQAARSRPAAALKRASDGIDATLAAAAKARAAVGKALPQWSKGKAAVAAVPLAAPADKAGGGDAANVTTVARR